MAHLTLARAKLGAERITHNEYPWLKLRVQFGRCFVLADSKTLACGHTWEETLDNLLQAQVVFYVNKHNLAIPPETPFQELAELFLQDPALLSAKYKPQPKEPSATINP